MNLVFKLYRLQQVDSQLDQSLVRLREIEAALSEDEALRAASARASESGEALQAARRSLKQIEGSTQAQRTKIEETERTLYSGEIKNPKELQDLQNELGALRRYLAVLEDRQLEAMLTVDELEGEYRGAQEHLESVQAQTRENTARLTAERAVLENDVERLKKERAAAASSIPPEPLKTYDALRLQRQGLAVARVVDKTCSACGSTLNAALLQEARSPAQIARCEFCGRMLYAN